MVAAAASSTIFWAWPAAAAVAAVALLMLADRFSGLCHARLHAPWIIRRRIAHHAPPYDGLLAGELLLRSSRGGQPVAYLNSGSILSPSLVPPGSVTLLSANFSRS